MARILNSLNSSNKEYSEKKYKYEKQIKELQEEMNKFSLKRLNGLIIEKKDYMLTFNKKHLWLLELLIFFNIFIVIGAIIYFYINLPHILTLKTILSYTFIAGLFTLIEIGLFHLFKIISTNNFIKHQNLFYDNQIKT